MQPLEPAKIIRSPVKQFIKEVMKLGSTRQAAKDLYNERMGDCWKNDLYTVLVNKGLNIPADMNPQREEDLVWISIRRNDREPIINWRDKQAIKNQLLGEECEAVEIYPAESRLVDTSNQYHLFGYANGDRLQFGFQQRAVCDISFLKSKQEPFNENSQARSG